MSTVRGSEFDVADYGNIKRCVEGVENDLDGTNRAWADWSGVQEVAFEFLAAFEALSDQASALIHRAIQTNGASLGVDLLKLECQVRGEHFPGSWCDRTNAPLPQE